MSGLLKLSLTVILIGLTPVSAYSDESKHILQIAVIDDVPSTQLARQLLTSAYAKLGIGMETRVVPSRRALLSADNGSLDGDLFRIEEVANQYQNLIQVPFPLLHGELKAVLADPHANQLPLVGDRPLTVAVRRGVIIAERTANDLGMTPVLAESYEQMRTLLEWGRVDLMLVSNIEGLSPVNKSEWQNLSVLPKPVTQFVLYHYLHRHHSDLAVPLADILKEMELSGEKLRLVETARKDDKSAGW